METRQVELSLDTAKRLYEQGGEYRDIALTAFKEHELIGDRLPKTWQEFCYSNDRKPNEAFISNGSEINCVTEQHLAYMQLHQLRDTWREGWLPDWKDDKQEKYIILQYKGEYQIRQYKNTSYFLSFQDEKRADEFLECFRDLIMKAGDLI